MIVVWGSGKVNLIVDDDVNGVVSVVVFKLVYLQGFVDDILICECSVIVYENGQYWEIFGVVEGVKFGMVDIFENWIDCFEVVGISGDRCFDGVI